MTPGIDKAEEFFNLENLYDIDNVALTHYIDNALRANYIMLRDIDYVVSPEQETLLLTSLLVVPMEGRRFSDGLHQAIEAKEGGTSPRGNQDFCLNHLPKYVPYVQEIVRYDWYW